MKTFLRWFALAVAGAATVLALVAIIAPRIELGNMRPRIEAIGGQALGRSIQLQGLLAVKVSLPPVLEAAQVRIGNPPNWSSPDFVRIEKITATVSLMPLLRGQIVIDEINARGVGVYLEAAADGRNNWTFPAGAKKTGEGVWKLAAINHVSLSDLAVQFKDQPQQTAAELVVEELTAQLPADDPSRINMAGTVQGFPFSIDATTASLNNLLTAHEPVPVNATVSLNNNRLQIDGSVIATPERQEIDASVKLEGARVADLAAILDASLPAIGKYRLKAELSGNAGALAISGIDGHLGKTAITGNLRLGRTGERMRIEGALQLNIDGLVIQGDIGVDRIDGEFKATAALHTQQADVGDLVERFTDLTGIAGKIGALALKASSFGEETRSLIDNLEVNVQLRDAAMTYSHGPGEKSIEIDLDEVALQGAPLHRARLSVDGRLLGEDFTADVELGDLPALFEERSLPFDLRAAGAGAELTMSGQLADETSADETTLQIQLSGQRFGELAPWLGVSPDFMAAYSLSGQLSLQNDRDAWRLRDLHAQIGRSSIDGAIGLSRLDGQPLLTTSLAFDVIDPLELERALTANRSPGEQKAGVGVDMNMPILPTDLNLKDMDIDIEGKRVVLEPSDITDIAFSTRIRDGHVSKAPFRGTLADTGFTGNLAMDLRGNIPEIELDLEALDVDIGNFLRKLQLAAEIDAHSKRMTAQVVSRGSSISELLDDTEINIETHAGRWYLTDPNQAGRAHIEVVEGTAKATTRTKQTVVKLDARIGEVPMDFTLETKRLPKSPGGKEFLDTKIKAIAAGAELTMQGLVSRLSGLRGLDLHVSLSGNRISSLDELLEVSLPPFGPYSVDGQLMIGDTEYSLSDITFRVGETIAKGHLKVSTAGAKPELTGILEAKTFRLDDFQLGDWSPVAVTNEEIEPNTGDNGISKKTTEQGSGHPTQAESTQPLLSKEVMHGFDGKADIRVGDVLSGQDRLGFGEMSIALQNGKLSLSLDVDLPGGEAALELSLQATEEEYAATLRTHVDNFDYGVFARRIEPDTVMAGKFSVDVDLASQGETLSLIDDNANGYFDFVIWPETLRSGVFDLWTANLFFAVLPVLNLQTQSRVNCLVGRLDVKDGVMKPNLLFMDTTRTQVKGKGKINFRTERIKLRLTPRSKRPKFFSLSTPVVVEGSFADFGVGLRPDDLLGTAIRMMATVVLVPGQYITQGVRPGVDTKKCQQAIGSRDE